MTLASDAALDPVLDRLGPYARVILDQAAAIALHLHAEELTPEHLLVAVLEDEESGAARLVLHAFGDPETIGIEVLALCPGIMVVGSARSLPFSVLGVEALEQARRSAAERQDQLVDIPHVFAAAVERLSGDVTGRLQSKGWGALVLAPDDAGQKAAQEAADSGATVAHEGPLFTFYSREARQALGAACRQATRLERTEISSVHLVLGCLEVEAGLGESVGTSAVRVRTLLMGLDVDPVGPAGPRPARAVPVDGRLRRLLEELAAPAGTTEMLGWIIAHGGEEVRALLHRQRITPTLLEHAGSSFEDPALLDATN